MFVPGCMKELWVNHKLVDFMNAARQQKVTPGCSLLQDEEQMVEEEGVKSPSVSEQEQSSTMVDEEQMEPQEGPIEEDEDEEDEEDEDEDEDPCYNNQCHKGSKCESKGIKEYTCKCQPGWSGKYCTQGKCHNLNIVLINKRTRELHRGCSGCSYKYMRTTEFVNQMMYICYFSNW